MATLPHSTAYLDRVSSPVLGSPSKVINYNQRTGRPVRKSAGKMKKAEGYVDFEDELDDEFGPLTAEESEEEEQDDMKPRRWGDRNKGRRITKRKRSPSPPSPFLEPLLYDQELEELTDNETGGAFHRRTPKKPPITLQFNVPLGYHGPLFVKLDSSILSNHEASTLHEMQPSKPKQVCTKSPQSQPAEATVRPKSFADLAPELRNSIYRYLFARKHANQDIRIPVSQHMNPVDNLCKSSQFLRTCKLVHNEGCSILYGENIFSFKRHFDTRGPFWEAVPKEIGYQDVLQFLKMIGPENLQYLRNIKFVFDDASPRHTSYVDSNEKRRYLNDEYLMNCLRILRDAKLRKICMYFGGRRQLQLTDVKFLGYLEQVKADEVERTPDRYFNIMGKVSTLVWNNLEEAMTRKKKLYEKE
ncbi:dna-binding protein [Pyrenophora seminiperda CCB06]|uniref:Dna-binding protein n=1 Tax=Pyrenophora seminiperda CCB06 TaxID=1302712 RepID=A0A3M7M5B4_9PLEO|nr:dna-binding protein [Pyrenophora seminiperda CCB06]